MKIFRFVAKWLNRARKLTVFIIVKLLFNLFDIPLGFIADILRILFPKFSAKKGKRRIPRNQPKK